jgi:hypothetical protein
MTESVTRGAATWLRHREYAWIQPEIEWVSTPELETHFM